MFLGSQGKPRETRKVRFSDGIHPGGIDQGDLSKKGTMDNSKGNGPRRRPLNQPGTPHNLIPLIEGALPPIVVATETKGGRQDCRCC